jgi:hypothetical protein
MDYAIAPKQRPSVDYIESRAQYLRTLYSPRNGEYQVLRRCFDGSFISTQESNARPDGLFNDRMRMVYNMTNASVRRYMDSLSAPPRVEAQPRGVEEADIELADDKSRVLEQIYQENKMPVLLIMAAYYQSLLDSAIFYARPCPEMECGIKIELAVPDNFMPMPMGDDWLDAPYLIYQFRSVGGDDIQIDPLTSRPTAVFNNTTLYWDKSNYVEVKDGREQLSITHKWGRMPWRRAHNIPIPHRYRGQGDVDQAIGLNSYINMLMSDFADMINYAANPITIVRGSKAGAANLNFGPRAIWELERDGQAGFLQWSGAPPTAEAQILRSIQAFEDMTGVSSPAFGREIPSGTSGQAVRSLLAGFNTRLGTKQQLLGEALADLNTDILLMLEREFPDKEYAIIGEDNSGKKVGRTVKPKMFKGFYKNLVTFDPIDPTARFFQEVEKRKEGLQSRYTTMKNLGIKNVSEELDRIRKEKIEDASHENNMGLARTGQFMPGGQPSPYGDGPLDLSQLLPPQADKDQARKLLGLEAPQRPADQKTPKPAPLVNADVVSPDTDAPDLADTAQRVGIDQIAGLLRPGDGRPQAALRGAVAVIGDTANQGYTEGKINFAISDPADEQAIRQALGKLSQRATFTVNANPAAQQNAVAIGGGSAKKAPAAPTEDKGPRVVKADAFLGVIVTDVESTGSAPVYSIAVQDDRGNFIQMGKTFPQRKVVAEQGELITIHIDGLSRRVDAQGAKRYAFVKPVPVRPPSPPARPALMSDLDKLFAKGESL